MTTSDSITEQAARAVTPARRREALGVMERAMLDCWTDEHEYAHAPEAILEALIAHGLLAHQAPAADLPERIARAIEAERPEPGSVRGSRDIDEGMARAARIARTFASASTEAPATEDEAADLRRQIALAEQDRADTIATGNPFTDEIDADLRSLRARLVEAQS